VELNKNEYESQTSISSIEKDSSLSKETNMPEFNKSGSGSSIFKLIKATPSNSQNYDKEKVRFKTKKKRSLRSLIKKKIPDYFKYISVLSTKDLSKLDGIFRDL
jgi:hypothetical protein